MAFNAIARRTVYVVNRQTGHREKFTIAIGAPYRPSKQAGMEEHAACPLVICEEVDEVGSEMFGEDEFEALENAIRNANLIFTGLNATGNVEWSDGRPFSVSGNSDFTVALRAMQDKLKRDFENKK